MCNALPGVTIDQVIFTVISDEEKMYFNILIFTLANCNFWKYKWAIIKFFQGSINKQNINSKGTPGNAYLMEENNLVVHNIYLFI